MQRNDQVEADLNSKKNADDFNHIFSAKKTILKLKRPDELLSNIKKTICAEPNVYGSPNNLSENGFILIASFGKEAWNEWFKSEKSNSIPKFSDIDFKSMPIFFNGFHFFHERDDGDVSLNCVVFSGCEFKDYNAGFRDCVFYDDADFTDCHFYGYIHFDRSEFHGVASFRNSHFHGRLSVNKAYFHRLCSFHDCDFYGKSVFESDFLQSASFVKSVFHDGAYFDRSKFWHATFYGSVFENDVSFRNCEMGYALFDYTKFGVFDKYSEYIKTFPSDRLASETIFSETDFKGNSSFMMCVFESRADFSAATTSPDSKKGCIFNDVSFQGSIFKGPIKFNNRKFNSVTNFSSHKDTFSGISSETIFYYAPEFHGCEIHQDTRFDKTVFIQRNDPDSARA